MKVIITIAILIISVNSFSQKVKFKKGDILVDGIVWCKYEKTAGKEFYSTLDGKEYMSVNYLSCGTGEYYKGGKRGQENIERRVSYQEIRFLNTEIEMFEVRFGYKELIRILIKEKVIENGVFNIKNAQKFKDKYQEFASERCKRNNMIIIEN